MKSFLILWCFICSFSGVSCQQNSKVMIEHVTPEKLQKALSHESIQLIDVRTPKEFKEGHINKALNIDFLSPDFLKSLEKLDVKQPVYVYCRSGKRSGSSIEVFEEAGFTHIINLTGGILNWQASKFPITVNN